MYHCQRVSGTVPFYKNDEVMSSGVLEKFSKNDVPSGGWHVPDGSMKVGTFFVQGRNKFYWYATSSGTEEKLVKIPGDVDLRSNKFMASGPRTIKPAIPPIPLTGSGASVTVLPRAPGDRAAGPGQPAGRAGNKPERDTPTGHRPITSRAIGVPDQRRPVHKIRSSCARDGLHKSRARKGKSKNKLGGPPGIPLGHHCKP